MTLLLKLITSTLTHPLLTPLMSRARPLTPHYRYAMNPRENNDLDDERWRAIMRNPTPPLGFPPFTLAPLFNEAAQCWETRIAVESFHVVVEWINCMVQVMKEAEESIVVGIFEYERPEDCSVHDKDLFCVIHDNEVVYFGTFTTAAEFRMMKFEALVDVAETAATLLDKQQRARTMQEIDYKLTAANWSHFQRMNGFMPYTAETRHYQFNPAMPHSV